MAGPPPTWPGDPTLSQRDEFVFLLHTAAEIEHALMVQYLYAAFCLPAASPWFRPILLVAKQEMGHLVTLQNILRSMHAPLNLEREDYPFRSDLYPFAFHLERVSVRSLAKYALAEMPAAPNITPADLATLHADAGINPADPLKVNRVGLLYDSLRNLVTNHLEDKHFDPVTEPLQAHPDDWRVDPSNGVIVKVITNRADVEDALRQIAEQGEGNQAPAPGEESHFDIFLRVYRERKAAANDPSMPVPTDPNTSPPPAAGAPVNPDEPELATGRLTDATARSWALLSNLRYRMLLTCIAHSLSLPRDDAGPEASLRNRAFDEMFRLKSIANILGLLPQQAGGDPKVAAAGLPFELPYSLTLGDDEKGRWLAQADLLESARLIREKLGVGNTPAQKSALKAIDDGDQGWQGFVNARLGLSPGPESAAPVMEIRLLPPLVIGRFGSSPEPMENYDIGAPGADGFRALTPAETLAVDAATGEISGVGTPPRVRFRDAAGRIKPVSPFVEVWARFGNEPDLRPLTIDDLRRLNLDASAIRWQVRAGNHKASRRTGDVADQIDADTGLFNDHAAHLLTGTCANFKAGKTIPFGGVRYIKPNAVFPEIRLRFTPAAGKVFGTRAGDPNIADDPYDSARGRWDGHRDGDANKPPSTAPGGIFAQNRQGRSLAYLDDACDAIIQVELRIPGNQPLTATSRISSGPPHFAPDRVPIRTVADELEQMLLGPALQAPVLPAEVMELGRQAADIVRRAFDTVRLMNTEAMNADAMSGHDNSLGRAEEPIFPATRAVYSRITSIHGGLASALAGLERAPGTPERVAAVEALQQMADILRSFDRVGDLTDAGRRRMPAMMRGADGLHLAVTRRQLAKVRQAATSLAATAPPPPPPAPPTTPEETMLALVRNFQAFANRHSAVDVGGGQVLRDLFGDPPQVLQYLRRGVLQGDDLPALKGQPLVRPGDPENSPFVRLLQVDGHPMKAKFAPIVPSLGKTGLQIVKEWIASLPPNV